MQRLSAHRRGYDRMWQRERDAFLKNNPLCLYCEDRGIITAASVVDHRIPHKGNFEVFWDRSNWVPCCKHCHDSYKQRLEKSGVDTSCDVNGMPQDSNHHWNKK